MTDRPMPLNGVKTRPLSGHAYAELRNLSHAPEPCIGINPGVVNRLLREELAEIVQLPSPFQTHKRKLINHLRITEAGRKALLCEAAP